MALSPRCETLAGGPWTSALVLGSGISAQGHIDAASRDRTLAAVALFRAGRVEHLVFTGRATGIEHFSVGGRMADLARQEGVPAGAITVESQAESTLENGLFSRPLLEGRGPVLLVTSGFHLWRARASMAWAGLPVAAACQSSPMAGIERPAGLVRLFANETVKTWGNLARATLWSLAARLGVTLPDWWLN